MQYSVKGGYTDYCDSLVLFHRDNNYYCDNAQHYHVAIVAKGVWIIEVVLYMYTKLLEPCQVNADTSA